MFLPDHSARARECCLAPSRTRALLAQAVGRIKADLGLDEGLTMKQAVQQAMVQARPRAPHPAESVAGRVILLPAARRVEF